MPEGDTIHKLANAMTPYLEGRRLERVEIHRQEASYLRHREVRGIRAVGKHLLIDLGDLQIRTHLGLHGSWHRYAVGERWKRPGWQASITMATTSDVFVCFNAKEVVCVESSRMPLHRPLTRLGPDLLGDEPDLDEVVARARRLPGDTPINEALLNQTIASGIGNVFKSEILFLSGLRPDTPLSRLSDDTLREIYETAVRVMRPNVDRGLRVTTEGKARHRHWVYGRADEACFRCSEPIRFARMARHRSTYWCPRCQG